MSEPIRVLHIFKTLSPGGIETLVMNIYRAIDRDKIQFDFALTGGEKTFYDDEVLSLGGRIFYFDPKKSIERNLSEVFKTKGPFRVMHSHVYFYSGVVLRCAARYNIPVRIAHAHNTSFGQQYTIKRRIYEWLMRRWILRYATDMFGCSEDACRFVFGKNCMKDPRCRVLHNGFDVKAYSFNSEKRNTIREHYHIQETQLVVGHVGRFEIQKNHNQLIDIFAEIHAVRSDSVLLMVGRGTLMEEIKEKCERLGLLDSCRFAGAQKDTPSYYSAMDVFLFPSLYEGLGSVLIEAQANGLSVVTTKDLVPKDIDVTGRASFVALNAPAEKWAKEVLKAENEHRADRDKSVAIEDYDICNVTAILSDIYAGH